MSCPDGFWMALAGHGQAMCKRCVQGKPLAGHGQEVGVEQVMGKSWASHGQENGAEQVAGLPDRVMQQQ
jgi:hypothetical protein